MAALGHNQIKKFDREFASQAMEDSRAYLTDCNRIIADKARELTVDLLNKVLYTASCGMKNGFARSDA